MLGDKFLSVKEIRAKLGNMDRSHCNREFKRFCGLTPSEFRRRVVSRQQLDDATAKLAADQQRVNSLQRGFELMKIGPRQEEIARAQRRADSGPGPTGLR
jgi:methylphosphotriester-DNA--protein-cysteine methyltransferase